MDLNKFIEKAMDKYSNRGVTMISMSYWGGILDIRLMRPEGSEKSPDTVCIGIDKPEEGEVIPVQYAHCQFKLPVTEEQIFSWIDKLWFNNTKTVPGYENPE